MLYICQYCINMVIYMSQKGLRQAGGVFCCLSGLSCFANYAKHLITLLNLSEHCRMTDLPREGYR